ncbi:MAG: hypothetical protein QOE30_2981 [Mycobacterium sp.]|nr:hypothetical protein [Mycobacterium sp.]
MLIGTGSSQFAAGQSKRAGTFVPRLNHDLAFFPPTVCGRTP